MAADITPAEVLAARLEGAPGVRSQPSRFSPRPAWWAGGTEIAHFHGDVLDVRLTHAVIRARRAELAAAGARFRGSGSEWVSLPIDSPAAVDVGHGLVIDAAGAHRPA